MERWRRTEDAPLLGGTPAGLVAAHHGRQDAPPTLLGRGRSVACSSALSLFGGWDANVYHVSGTTWTQHSSAWVPVVAQ